tara:strand:+ start:12 stop:1445 length:1434 start_codon:yes stop_codon:yes gene_type:complete
LENRLRLAPSPTGLLHIGTARTALFNWLYAKKTNGKFLLRIEDTDTNRSKSEFTENILNGLDWLGLSWDGDLIEQSTRIEIHKSEISKLLDQGLAYRCFTSEEEIKKLREQQKIKGLPPRHDNRHRDLKKEDIDKFIREGRSSVIRFKINDDQEIMWEDQIRGKIYWRGKDLGGDMVLSRRSFGYEIGNPLYNLAVVVDDNFMKVNHVVRGEDHISNTAKQILLYKALNYELPIFSHTPLILNKEGKKLSKRDSVTSIDDFRKMGYLPNAMTNYMALLGWSVKTGDNEIQTIDEISKKFELKDVNKAGAKFNWEKLNWINSQYIKKMKINDLYKIFQEYWQNKGWKEESSQWGLELTELLQDSITVLNDIVDQSAPFFEIPKIDKDGEAFLKENTKLSLEKIYESLNQDKVPINKNIAKNLINKISIENSIKKGIVMKSLRVAFFGCLSGPDLVKSWELFSANKQDIKRIQRCLDTF